MNRQQRRIKEKQNKSVADNTGYGIRRSSAEISAALNEKKYDEAKRLCYLFLDVVDKGTEARKVAELLVKLDPKNADAFNLLGVVHFNNSEYIAAGKSYEQAIKINPHHGMTMMNYGNLLHSFGNLKEAGELYRMSLEYLETKYHSSVYINMANILMDQSLFPAALELAEKAYDLDKNNTGIASILGNIHVAMKDDSKAEKYYLKSVKSDIIRDKVHNNLGKLYNRIKDFDKSALFYANAFRINEEQYGKEFDTWPQKDPGFKELYYSYYLARGITQKEEHKIFINDNMDSYFAGSDKVYREFDEHKYVAHINDIDLIGNGWNIFIDNRLYWNMVFFIYDWSGRPCVAENNKKQSYVILPKYRETTDEPVIILGGASNYYHWLCDYLPRLELMEKCPELNKLSVLINEDLKSFQYESLSLIGFDCTRLKKINHETTYNLKDAYILYLKDRPLLDNNVPDWMNPALTKYETDWLRKTYAPWMKPKKENPKRLFLSRKGAKFRLCLNEDEIFDIAKEYGFEKVQNENMSFAEQIELYSGVEAVMGVHGAGFTNMVFAPENATLIEIHSKNELPPFYKHMTSLIGQKHYAVDGIVTEALRPLTSPFWNFEIDPVKVRTVLEELERIQ